MDGAVSKLDTMEVPVISLAQAFEGRKEVVREEVMKASKEWGIFQVVEHGVPPHVIAQMMDSTLAFFSLPLEEKKKFMVSSKSGSQKFRGYSQGSFVENDPVKDRRELLLLNCLPHSLRNEEEWPQQFRESLRMYSQHMERLAEVLIGIIAEGLGVKARVIEEVSGEVEERVLLNYYPPNCSQPKMQGLRRHTDHGSITILYQDMVGGLQVTKDGGETWVTLEPLTGAFVVNLGDFMNILSNKEMKSADHRVFVNSSTSRVTIATFFNPSPTSMVRPLVGGDHQIPFEPCTFMEFYSRKIPSSNRN